MVTVRKSDGAVSVLPLLETRIGLAIYDGDVYRRIGQIRPAEWTEPGRREGVVLRRKGFAWYFDDEEFGRDSGHEVTQREAIAALLAAGGYGEAPPNAANPGLFDLGGDAA